MTMPVRPDISASLAACFADEARLDIGEPHVIRPSVGASRDRMAAMEIRAVNENAAHAGVAHLAEGDFLGPFHDACRAEKRRRPAVIEG
jgi:hypothetical protein